MDVKVFAMTIVVYSICSIRNLGVQAATSTLTDKEAQVCQPLSSYLKGQTSQQADVNSGMRGQKGHAGKIGPVGPAGTKGSQGEPGSPGARGTKGESGKMGRLEISSSDDVPSCNASMRGAVHLVENKIHATDMVMVCRRMGDGVFKWTELSSFKTGHDQCMYTVASSCSDLLQQLLELNCPTPDGHYHIYDSFGQKTMVYCDMTTAGGGWLLIGKAFTPSLWNLKSTASSLTMTSGQGWSSRFGGLNVADFRVQFSTSPLPKDTKGHWYHHLSQPRPLSLIFTSGLSNGCYGNSISNIQYTLDIRNNSLNEQHRCAIFQYQYSRNRRVPPLRINGCFNSTGCSGYYQYGNGDGSFSFHGTASSSGDGASSTAFLGCDEYKCCACWGPIGGRGSYCGAKCSASDGHATISHSAYAWFYVR